MILEAEDINIGSFVWNDKENLAPRMSDLQVISEQEYGLKAVNEGLCKPDILWIPVRLTMHWLNAFNFEYYGLDAFSIHRYERDGFILERELNSRTYICTNISIDGQSGIRIEFVHELQSLYRLIKRKTLELRKVEEVKDQLEINLNQNNK